MGQTEVTLPPETRRKVLKETLKRETEVLIEAFEKIRVELPLPFNPEGLPPDDYQVIEDTAEERYLLDFTEGSLSTFKTLKDWVEKEDPSLEDLERIRKELREIIKILVHYSRDIKGERNFEIKISPTEEREITSLHLQFGSQAPTAPLRDALEDLEKIRQSAKSGVVKVAKDFWKSQIWSPGDALEFIKDEKTKKTIRKKAEEGKYIAGTRVGLSGGERYFKIFCLVLAQTLNEQSKFYNTQEDLSGVPQALISQYAGEGAIVEKIKEPSPIFKGGGKRPYPIIFLSWEDLAKKMSAKGEITGGKDIKQVRDYVLGGVVKKKDKKTGIEKETFVPGLLGREYLVEGAKSIVGVPLMSKIFSLYPKDSPDKEVGIAVQLSPLFAIKNVFGYTGIRSDTIQLLGGGKQRELTINLFLFPAYYRGVPPQTGRNKGEFVQRKEDLLKDLSSGIAYYTGRPGLLEKHFIDAVRKCIEAKILLPGETKTGLKGYREEVNPGGERLSIFTYNPDYLKGEEVTLFTEIEEQ